MITQTNPIIAIGKTFLIFEIYVNFQAITLTSHERPDF